MCGRYALALRPSHIRARLNMQVDDAPEDDGDDAPRQSYNFAPGYHGIVYRADTPDWGAGSRHRRDEASDEAEPAAEPQEADESNREVRYKLQSMKWGLIPFWTKRNPDYASIMRTINCRDDSLLDNRGMWTTMKQRKRCIVIAEGFYEWLKKGKEKVPHYVKRKDGQLMCFAGLWDCVQYEGSAEKLYSYTVITTSPNKQIDFLHDRMPVILENGSEAIQTWLDPKRTTWSKDLQCLLRPFEGELEIYAVSKDVGKVGNNSRTFIIPVASSANKSNIANFFAKGAAKKDESTETSKPDPSKTWDAKNEEEKSAKVKPEQGEVPLTIDYSCTEKSAILPGPVAEFSHGVKRDLDDGLDVEPPKKFPKSSSSPSKSSSLPKPTQKFRSATSNNTASPTKPTGKDKGSKKITSFFGK